MVFIPRFERFKDKKPTTLQELDFAHWAGQYLEKAVVLTCGHEFDIVKNTRLGESGNTFYDDVKQGHYFDGNSKLTFDSAFSGNSRQEGTIMVSYMRKTTNGNAGLVSDKTNANWTRNEGISLNLSSNGAAIKIGNRETSVTNGQHFVTRYKETSIAATYRTYRNPTLYENGRPVSDYNSRYLYEFFSLQSQNDIVIGNYRDQTAGYAFNGWLFYVYLFNKRFSDDEVASLHEAPYQLLKPRRRYFHIKSSMAVDLGQAVETEAAPIKNQGEPAFFIPRFERFKDKKPTTRQQVDFGHWAAQHIEKAVILTSGDVYDLVESVRLTKSGNTDFNAVKAGQRFHSVSKLTFDSPIHAVSEGTILVSYNISALLHYYGLLSDKTVSNWGRNNGVSLNLRYDGALLKVGDDETFTANRSHFIRTDVETLIGATYKLGQNGVLYENGKPIPGNDYDRRENYSPVASRSNSNARIGTYYSEENAYSLDGWLFYVYLFNKRFSDDEIASLHEAPYQFLKQRRKYFIFGGTPDGKPALSVVKPVGLGRADETEAAPIKNQIEEALFIPRFNRFRDKKPTSHQDIDFGHWAAQHIEKAVVLTSGDVYDLAKGIETTKSGNTDFDVIKAGQRFHSGSKLTFDSPIQAVSEGTIIVSYNRTSTSHHEGLLSDKTASNWNQNNGVSLNLKYDAALLKVGNDETFTTNIFTTNPHFVRTHVETSIGATYKLGQQGVFYEDGKPVDGGDYEQRRNYSQVASRSVSNARIGTYHNEAADNSFDGWIFYAYLFNKRLNDDEIASLHEAPYQFLKPRRKYFIFDYTRDGKPAHSVIKMKRIGKLGESDTPSTASRIISTGVSRASESSAAMPAPIPASQKTKTVSTTAEDDTAVSAISGSLITISTAEETDTRGSTTETAFFVPRFERFRDKKPTSHQDIDFGHWAAQHIEKAVIFTSGDVYDLVENVRLTKSGNTYFDAVKAGQRFHSVSKLTLGSPIQAVSEGTIVASYNRTSSHYAGLLSDKTVSNWGINNGVNLNLRNDGALLKVGDDETFTTNNSHFVASEKETSISAAYKLGQQGVLYENGKPIPDNDYDTRENYSPVASRSNNNAQIGTYYDETGYFSFDGWLFYVYLFNKRFSDDEIASLHEAPYQFLKPRRKYFIFGDTVSGTQKPLLSTTKQKAFNRAAEADIAKNESVEKNKDIGRVHESDAAGIATIIDTNYVNITIESDIAMHAPVPAGQKTQRFSMASESDAGNMISSVSLITISTAAETDAADSVGRESLMTLRTATESDTIAALDAIKTVLIAQSIESDNDLTISRATNVSVGQATENDLILALIYEIAGLGTITYSSVVPVSDGRGSISLQRINVIYNGRDNSIGVELHGNGANIADYSLITRVVVTFDENNVIDSNTDTQLLDWSQDRLIIKAGLAGIPAGWYSVKIETWDPANKKGVVWTESLRVVVR